MKPESLNYAPLPPVDTASPRGWLGIATLLTTIFAFPLIWMGGLVTSHSAGMSVPDWPNSYGYNMFALPFGQWMGQYAGGTFYEHTHRLLGTLVGLAAFIAAMIAWGPSRRSDWRAVWRYCTYAFSAVFFLSLAIAWTLRYTNAISESTYRPFTHVFSTAAMLAITSLVLWRCQRRDPDAWRRWMVTSVLVAIIIQGLMGGFRVTEISLLLAKVHGIFGQMVFALAAAVAVMCSRWWTTAPREARSIGAVSKRLLWVCLVLVTTQLILGAFMRHDPLRDPSSGGGAGLSIPDWPLHYGKVLPPTSAVELAKINQYRRWELRFGPTSLGQIWLQFSHRVVAYITGLCLLATAAYLVMKHGRTRLLYGAILMGVMVVAQITLGVLTVLWRKPADVATLHQAGGAVLLMLVSVLLVRAYRLYSSTNRLADAPATSVAVETNPLVTTPALAARR